jgi:hypothetical protein
MPYIDIRNLYRNNTLICKALNCGTLGTMRRTFTCAGRKFRELNSRAHLSLTGSAELADLTGGQVILWSAPAFLNHIWSFDLSKLTKFDQPRFEVSFSCRSMIHGVEDHLPMLGGLERVSEANALPRKEGHVPWKPVRVTGHCGRAKHKSALKARRLLLDRYWLFTLQSVTNNLPLVSVGPLTGALPSPDWAKETSHARIQQVRGRTQPQRRSNSHGTRFNVSYRQINHPKRVTRCRVAGDKSSRTVFRSTSSYRSWRRQTY